MVEVQGERLVVAGDDLGRQVLGLDHRARRGDHRLLEDVLQLAHVPRPVVREQPRQRLPRDRPRWQPARGSFSRKCSTRSGMSSSRSRSGGSSIENTLSR